MIRKTKKTKRSRQDAVYEIALAGICAAVALLFVGLSVLVRFSTIAFYAAAGIALMTPLYKKYYAASIFAYIVSSLLAFAIAGDIFTVAGYVAYFGPMAIFTAVMLDKKVKWFIAYPLKILYINGALALLYFVCGTIMIDMSVIGDIPYWAIALIGTAGLLLIDLVMMMAYKYIVPKAANVIRTRKKNAEVTTQDDEDDSNPFEDDELYGGCCKGINDTPKTGNGGGESDADSGCSTDGQESAENDA